jgi:hypothetical protein
MVDAEADVTYERRVNAICGEGHMRTRALLAAVFLSAASSGFA